MKLKLSILCALLLVMLSALADEYKVDGIYPTNWWVGMKNPNLQLILRGSNISRKQELCFP